MTESWLLIRGLMRSANHWGAFAHLLQDQLGGNSQVHYLDVAGNGQRHQEVSQTTITAMAADLRQHWQQQHSGHRVWLVGLSMGGMIATEWRRQWPEDIAGCVLINSSMRPLSPFYQRLQWQRYQQFWQLLIAKDDKREEVVFDLTCNSPAARELVVRHWQHLAQTWPVGRTNALRQLLAAARYQLPAAIPTSPTLIVAGQQDQLVDPRCSDAIAKHWHCDIVQHPSAGHDIPIDDPDWLARQIANWHQQLEKEAAQPQPQIRTAT